MVSKSVLIVARDFPPYFNSLGGVIRVLKLADFLLKKGFTVHVVASEGIEISYFGYENVVERINVHYVPDLLQRRSNRKSMQSTPPPSGQQRSKLAALARKARFIISELAVPDLGVFFVRGLYRHARKIAEKHAIKNVIVSSPPFSTQAIGWLLKRRFGQKINLIVDYRDSWNTLSIFAKHWPLTRAVNRYLERKVLASSDHLLYQSPPVITKIEKMFPGVVRHSELVMNGFDPSMALPDSLPNPENTILTIGHFGAISDNPNGFRNPAALLQAVFDLDLPIRFVFYGAPKLSHHWQDLLGERFVLAGNLSHQEALYEMARMDVLMLVHSDPDGADEVIPAKIFEYMSTGRPILAAGPKTMESARIVREKKLGYALDILDSAEITAVFQRMLEDWRAKQLVHYEKNLLMEFSRPVQYAKILPLLS